MNIVSRAEVNIDFVYNLRKEIEVCILKNDNKTIVQIMKNNNLTKNNILELFNIFNFTKDDTDMKKTLKTFI